MEHQNVYSAGVFSDFFSSNDFTMAFSVANSMNRIGEDYSDTLSQSCLQSMRFLNLYASRVNVSREDVSSMLHEFGLPPDMIPRVLDRVIELSKEYHSLVDTFIQSLSSYSLIDFNWSLRMIICHGNSTKRQSLVVRLTLNLQDKSNQATSIVLELDKQQLNDLLSIFDSIDHVKTLGLLNKQL